MQDVLQEPGLEPLAVTVEGLGDDLSVEPDGETTGGAHTPVASAAVGELKHDRSGAGTVTVLPLTLSWEARQGCDRVKAKMRLQLRADDKSCKEPPEAPKGLLKPVQ